MTYEIPVKYIPPFVKHVTLQVPEYVASTSLSFRQQLDNDSEFQRWIFLYYNKIKNTDEYKGLYQKLRSRYKISPIQIVNQY